MNASLLAWSTALLVLVTLLPLSKSSRWWIRALDFPRLQIASLGIALFLIEVLKTDRHTLDGQLILVATAACVLYQAWWIIPYSKPFPNEVKLHAGGKTGDTLRILTANVLAPNHHADKLIALIKKHEPDIFVTLESDRWWEAHLAPLESGYPYTIKCPLDNLYGMHVYSRLPLEDARIEFLVEPDIPSMHANVILPSQRRVRTYFLHPRPPAPQESEESTDRDAELLIVAKQVAQLKMPVIVAGDLNDVAWSGTTRLFRKISGLLDPRVGRGMFNTFHADYWFMRWPLDHLFHSQHFTLSFIRRLPSFGSDHFPVLVELVYDVAHGKQQEGLTATADDKVEAEEKIEEALVQNSTARATLKPDSH